MCGANSKKMKQILQKFVVNNTGRQRIEVSENGYGKVNPIKLVYVTAERLIL